MCSGPKEEEDLTSFSVGYPTNTRAEISREPFQQPDAPIGPGSDCKWEGFSLS
jgi:hypothetical protein